MRVSGCFKLWTNLKRYAVTCSNLVSELNLEVSRILCRSMSNDCSADAVGSSVSSVFSVCKWRISVFPVWPTESKKSTRFFHPQSGTTVPLETTQLICWQEGQTVKFLIVSFGCTVLCFFLAAYPMRCNLAIRPQINRHTRIVTIKWFCYKLCKPRNN